MTGTMRAAALEGSFAYLLEIVPGNPSTTDLVTVDLGEPSQPTIVSRLPVSTGATGGVKVVGSLAYVAAGTTGLQVVDVSAASNPHVLGAAPIDGIAVALAVGNGYAYVATTTAVHTVDVHTPTQPILKFTLTTPATALAVSGTRLYVLGAGQFKVIDVANPTDPVVLSTSYGYSAQDVAVTGNAVVLSTPASSHFDPNGGVYVLDVSNPTQPWLIDQIVVPGTTRAIAAEGNLAYVGDSASTLDVISLWP
jgi:hypothetical protein